MILKKMLDFHDFEEACLVLMILKKMLLDFDDFEEDA